MTTRTRTIEWQDPMLTANAANGKTGLELMNAMIAGEVPPPPMARTLGFTLSAVGEGFARFEGTAEEFHYNPMGVVHGGLACTLLDSALGCAVMTTLDASTAYTTTEISVHLTKTITKNTGKLIAEAKVLHRGGRLATAEAKLLDSKGALLAHATTSCMIFPRPK